jgi:xylulokinase
MLSIGLDLGSSFVKGVLWDSEQNRSLATATVPEHEMAIDSPVPGWAEQHPEWWWQLIKRVFAELFRLQPDAIGHVNSIGISYQMHGLVLLNHELQVLRPAIIWCDSRSTGDGLTLLNRLSKQDVSEKLLNEPGNFTISKLAWVIRNEPELAGKIRWVLLPGDYIAAKLTGQVSTTVTGLSEGIFWDFQEHRLHEKAVNAIGARTDWFPPVMDPSQPLDRAICKVQSAIASELGLAPQAWVTFRAGDQPMNAYGLGVEKPGVWAASGGTSGVLYAVHDDLYADTSRATNRFAHVNHTVGEPRIGSLCCINGTGIAYSWAKKQLYPHASYEEVNAITATAEPGSEGIHFYPFGNGGERLLENRIAGAGWSNLDFNRHSAPHLIRAVLEGIVFSFAYAVEMMGSGFSAASIIRTSGSGLFQSDVFIRSLSSMLNAEIECVSEDGATGAARGAALLLSHGPFDASHDPVPVTPYRHIQPEPVLREQLLASFHTWKTPLTRR